MEANTEGPTARMKEKKTHGGSLAGSETCRRNQRPRRGLVSEHEGLYSRQPIDHGF